MPRFIRKIPVIRQRRRRYTNETSVPIRRGTTVTTTIQRIKIPELTAGPPTARLQRKGNVQIALEPRRCLPQCQRRSISPSSFRHDQSELFDLALCQTKSCDSGVVIPQSDSRQRRLRRIPDDAGDRDATVASPSADRLYERRSDFGLDGFACNRNSSFSEYRRAQPFPSTSLDNSVESSSSRGSSVLRYGSKTRFISAEARLSSRILVESVVSCQLTSTV